MKRTRVTTTRTALIAALAVLLCTAVGLAILLPTAQAHNSSSYPSGTVQIGEIFNSSAGTFDEANLQKLINILYNGTTTDGAPTSVTELSGNVSRNTTTFGKAGDADANTYAKTLEVSNKKIIVKFGGIDWIPVFLSLPSNTNTATNGNTPNANDVILTLWQAQGNSYSVWAYNGSTGWSDNNNGTNPSNMYGTSYIRAVTLNNGGQYATSKSALSGVQAQNANNAYARFTMKEINGVHNAAYDSIVSPRYINWQEFQNSHNVLYTSASVTTPTNWLNGYLNNESWGNTQGKTWHNPNIRYDNPTNYPHYSDWKDDLLWLPSDGEVGFTDTNQQAGNSNGTTYTGLWNTTVAQRSNNGSGSDTFKDCAWLRTASNSNYSYAHCLTSDGSRSTLTTDQSLLVRPALHLNLTAAMGEVEKPTDTEQNEVFNGQQHSFDLGITSSWANGTNNRVNIQITQNDGDGLVDYTGETAKLTATKAGTYKVTVTPATGWHWRGSNNAEPLTFTLTINPAPLTITPTVKSGAYNGQTHDTDVSFTGLFDTLTRNTDYSIEFNKTPQNADEYTVTVTLLENEKTKNYSLSGNTFTYIINKAPLTVTANDVTITYGDDAKNEGVSYNGFIEGEDKEVLKGDLTFTYDGYSVGDGVGEYQVILPSGLTADNYEISYEKGTLNVKAKKITVAISNAGHVYGGEVDDYDIVDPAEGWVGNDSKQTLLDLIKFTLKKQISPNDTVELSSALPVGAYTITVKNGTYGNYDVTFTSGEYTVTPATLTVTPTSTSGKYNGLTHDTDVTFAGIKNSDLLTKDTDYTVAFNNTPKDAGGYVVTIKLTDSATAKNYTLSNDTFTYTVTEAELSVTGNATQQYTYGFTADTPTKRKFEISATTVDGQEVSFAYRNFTHPSNMTEGVDYLFEGGVYTVWNAGTYTVVVEITAPNHKTEIRTLTISIAKAKADVKLTYKDGSKPTEVKTSGTLPQIDAVATVNGHTVEGTARWITSLGSITVSNPNARFEWQWTPVDTDNIEVHDDAEFLNVVFVGVRKLIVEFDAKGRIFYDTDNINDLKQYLKVTVEYTDNNQNELGMNEYTLTYNGGTTLVAGKGLYVTVTYHSGVGDPATSSFQVDVVSRLEQRKSEANAELDEWYDEQKGIIEGNEELTDEEKQTALDELDKKYKEAQDKIKGAKTVEEVDEALANAKKPTEKPKDPEDPNEPNEPNEPDDPSDPKDPTPTEPKETTMDKIINWLKTSPLPLAYAAIVLGAELLLIIILAIAARKPKQK